ncbi:hypothetical protein D9V41_13075 [Aeromicrobium phragmitis]|uniref:Mce-associated membrane protein n=2 Tax=Aeromicrobium phragmitis TaxID=2478914 RepID=A0A3L8PIN9_9ACTN|nr:hypothetical protein D9V41_13075 [Aeromicrobium phragmitis]
MTEASSSDTADEVETADVADDGTPERSPRTSRGRLGEWLILALAVVLAISGVVAGWLAWNDDTIEQAQTRDAVLVEARQHIETMNTLDYREVDEGLAAWADVTTGTLHDQLVGVSDEEKQLLAEQQMISTGKVVDAAVTDFDASSATVIAAVEVTVEDDADPDAEPTVKRNRFSAELLRVEGEWKLENLQQVAVNLS